MSDGDSLVYCCSASAWPLPDTVGPLEGSRPPSVKAALSLRGSPSVWPSADASGTPGDRFSEELSSPSLSGDRGRQWSGMISSDRGSAAEVEAWNGLRHSGFCSYTGPLSPGKQITAKYQWALTKQEFRLVTVLKLQSRTEFELCGGSNWRLTTRWWEQRWSPSGTDPRAESTS